MSVTSDGKLPNFELFFFVIMSEYVFHNILDLSISWLPSYFKELALQLLILLV